MPTPSEIAELVAARKWYHTLELAPGVLTPGWFDTRAVAPKIPFPDLPGKRCLDVGTFDGFWAFEMERRGAGEVLAIDIIDPSQWDWPPGSDDDVKAAIAERKGSGDGFAIARDALNSSVQRIECNVYDLDPEVHGMFDVVYVGSILLHLRDPVRALDRVRAVCRGTAVIVDAIDLPLTVALPWRPVALLDGRGRPWWWKPNVAGLVQMVEAAGFTVDGKPRRLSMPPGAGQPTPPLRPHVLKSPAGRTAAYISRRGDPHAAVVARPRFS
jgi:tRNA (mo5U34)-methyltransferase